MHTIQALKSRLGINPKDVENWNYRRERGDIHMWTEYESTSPGRARLYSKENAIELCVATIFTAAGATLGEALAFVRPFMEWAELKTHKRRRYWVFPIGSFMSGRRTDDLSSLPKMMEEFETNSLCIVDTYAVIKKIEDLYDKPPENGDVV